MRTMSTASCGASWEWTIKGGLAVGGARMRVHKPLAADIFTAWAGQLGFSVEENLEVHVSDRPVGRLPHLELPLGISEHHLGKRLPRKTGRAPSMPEGCRSFRLFFLPGTPIQRHSALPRHR